LQVEIDAESEKIEFRNIIPLDLKPATHIWDDDFGLQSIIPDSVD
jgi:hypothetical protein